MTKEEKITQENQLYGSILKKISSSGFNFNILNHKPLFTIEDVYVLNIKPEQMGKTLILSVFNYGLIAVVIPGNLKLDLAKIAKIFFKKRDEIKFTERKEVEHLGIEIGAISPFSDCFSSVIVDESFLSQEMIYCGSGDLSRTISISVEGLIKITSAKVVDVIKKKG